MSGRASGLAGWWWGAALLFSNIALLASTPPDAVCGNNLRQIDSAALQFALENSLDETNSYSLTDSNLLVFLKNSLLPACPAGGVYRPGKTFEEEPACSIHGTAGEIDAAYQQRVQESTSRERAQARRGMLTGTGVAIGLVVGYYFLRKWIVRRFTN